MICDFSDMVVEVGPFQQGVSDRDQWHTTIYEGDPMMKEDRPRQHSVKTLVGGVVASLRSGDCETGRLR